MVCGQSSTGKKTFVNSLSNSNSVIPPNNNTPPDVGFSPDEFLSSNNANQDETEDILKPTSETSATSDFYGTTANTDHLSKNKDYYSANRNRLLSNDILQITTHKIEVNEPNATPISLNVVLTQGFNEAINNEKCHSRLMNYLESQFNQKLQEECRIKRNPRFVDNRIHVALYFINATSKGLSDLDIQVMSVLATRVNLIPIIAKADLLTTEEVQLNKSIIMKDIKRNNIQIFDFNANEIEEEQNFEVDDFDSNYNQDINEKDKFNKKTSLNKETSQEYKLFDEEAVKLNELVPFTVIGSNHNIPNKTTGLNELARKYDWGEINIEDSSICDFTILKTILFGSHIQEFKDITHNVLYEKFRTEKLTIRNNMTTDKNDIL